MLMFLKGKTMFASVATSTMTIRHVQTQSTLDRLVETVRLGLVAHRQRSALRGLDDRRLADIGLSAIQADTEANRSFWDVPASWRR
jgi:uncharacterized protein YjiS (DUF1127 family)